MKRSYTFGGKTVELEAVPDMLGVRFSEPAPYSARAAAVRGPEFGEFEKRTELPREKFTIFKVSPSPVDPEKRLAAAAATVSRSKAVERVSPIFAVGDAYAMATERLLVGFTSAKASKDFIDDFEEVISKEGNEYVVRLASDADPFKSAADLMEYEGVEYAEPDFVNFGSHLPRRVMRSSDDKKGTGSSEVDQYAIRITQAVEAWQLQKGDPKIRIAILDEGVDTGHEDLASIIVGNYDGVDDDDFQEPKDWDAHGTACAGLAAARHDNEIGVKGIGGGCSILAVRIAYSASRGANWTTRNSWIARAIDWSWRNDADVLSNSWGGGTPSAAIANAFHRARSKGRGGKGAVLVMAAGNANRLHDFPSSLDEVLTVSASNEYDEPKTPTSRDGERWWGSSYGPKVDVAAPGVHNATTDNSGPRGYNRVHGEAGNYTPAFNGTSSSTPIVAGAIGLVLSANPDLTEAEVRDIIRNSADKVGDIPYVNGRNDRMGHGRLNVLRAVKMAKETEDRVVPTGLHAPVTNEVGDSEAEVTLIAVKHATVGSAATDGHHESDGQESLPQEKARGAGKLAPPPAPQAPDISGLQDIATASYIDMPSPETVHGVDDRRRIKSTKNYPWRATASLVITARDDSSWIGTGWFIGPNTLVTAGHCVYIHRPERPERHGFVKRIVVIPGRNENEMPYGSAASETFFSVKGWTEHGRSDFDYGAIKISTGLGDKVGTLGFGVFGRDDLMSVTGNIAGYPGDKEKGTLWYDHNRVARVSDRKIYYDIDTAGGQSGAAVYKFEDGQRIAFGIHAYGGAINNSATRITTPVFQNLTNWNEDD